MRRRFFTVLGAAFLAVAGWVEIARSTGPVVRRPRTASVRRPPAPTAVGQGTSTPIVPVQETKGASPAVADLEALLDRLQITAEAMVSMPATEDALSHLMAQQRELDQTVCTLTSHLSQRHEDWQPVLTFLQNLEPATLACEIAWKVGTALDEETEQRLIHRLWSSPDPHERRLAERLLARRGGQKAISAIAFAAEADVDPETRRRALESMIWTCAHLPPAVERQLLEGVIARRAQFDLDPEVRLLGWNFLNLPEESIYSFESSGEIPNSLSQ